MPGEPEPTVFGGLFKGVVDGALSVGRHDEISHDAALDANQVMVMSDEVFIELVASMVVAARNFVHHSGTFEVGKVPI